MANSATRKLLLDEAHRRGYQTQTIGPNANFLKITHIDGRYEIFRGSQPRLNSALSFKASSDKSLALDFVVACGYEVAPYKLVESVRDAEAFLATHNRIVLKPLDSSQSMGVTVNITNKLQLNHAFNYASSFSKTAGVIAQEHIDGKLYRLLMINGKLIAATLRTSIEVIGDGQQTVRELVQHLNTDPRRGDAAELGLKLVNLDDVAKHLGETLIESIPPTGKIITLSSFDSVPGGGAVNVTEDVHSDWVIICNHLMSELGMFIAGFDFICADIAAPLTDNKIPLLEINGGPGLRIHEFPTVGEPVHVAPILLDAVFPINTVNDVNHA